MDEMLLERPLAESDETAFDFAQRSARERTLLARDRGEHLPLAVAASILFDRIRDGERAPIRRREYESALELTAAAISCVVPVFTLSDAEMQRVAVDVDLVRQRFAGGANELRSGDGTVIVNLSVKRADLARAEELMQRAGLDSLLAAVLEPAPAAPKIVTHEAQRASKPFPAALATDQDVALATD